MGLRDLSLRMKPTGAIRTGKVSTNAVNLQCENVGYAVNSEISPLVPDVQVIEPFVGCTALTATLETCETEGGTYKEVSSCKAPVVELKAGYHFRFGKLPNGLKAWNRISFSVAGTATAGDVVAIFTDRVQSNLL